MVCAFGNVAFDVLAGARYWHQKMDVGLDLSTTVDLGDLVLRGNKAIAKSGSVDWLDAFAGVRARVSLAPGQNLQLRGDLSRGHWVSLQAGSRSGHRLTRPRRQTRRRRAGQRRKPAAYPACPGQRHRP